MAGSDKRTVATDALETLGTIIDETAGRDAIHLAVEPAVAGHALRPGDHVGRLPDGTYGLATTTLGIVDPFLTTNVFAGQRFWLVVYPRQITSLRHVWTHPAFPQSTDAPAAAEKPSKSTSVKWLENYASELGVDYDELMRNARAYVDQDHYWCEGDRFEGVYVPEDFWIHFAAVTGVAGEGSFFSCSC